MLSRCTLTLETSQETPLSYQMASLFHGVLMEHIETAYAECLHRQALRPYSQYFHRIGEKELWRISTLNTESYEGILRSFIADSFQAFELKKKEMKVRVLSKTYESQTMNEFIEKYYFGEGKRRIRVHFLTPCAFKSEGRYIFWPEIKLIYQSLMNKFDAVSAESTLGDEEVLNQLVAYSELTQYRIRSTFFSMEGIGIPSFLGEITIKIHGPQQLVNLANTLFRFGEYSGIGIKTAVGMGAVELVERMKE